MNTTLYNIQNDYLELISEVESLDGEITPEMETALSINQQELGVKSMGYMEVIKQKELFNRLVDDEINRLQGLKKRNATTVGVLKERLLQAVTLFGDFTVGTLSFGTRKSTAVVITDVDELDNSFKTVKVTTQPNKAEIKKAINNGLTVEGAQLVENLNLKIK